MNIFCLDRDLLAVEPAIFLAGGLPAQELARGTGGTLHAATFTTQNGNFANAGITPGMVLSTYSAAPGEGNAWEILAVNSPSQLAVSVLRANDAGEALLPPETSGLSYFVRTFAPQIRNVSDALAEKLRQLPETAGIRAAAFADSAQLRLTTVLGTLAAIFTARAEGAAQNDVNWTKAGFYRQEFARFQTQLRLVADADGPAGPGRSLGNVTLRRR